MFPKSWIRKKYGPRKQTSSPSVTLLPHLPRWIMKYGSHEFYRASDLSMYEMSFGNLLYEDTLRPSPSIHLVNLLSDFALDPAFLQSVSVSYSACRLGSQLHGPPWHAWFSQEDSSASWYCLWVCQYFRLNFLQSLLKESEERSNQMSLFWIVIKIIVANIMISVFVSPLLLAFEGGNSVLPQNIRGAVNCLK